VDDEHGFDVMRTVFSESGFDLFGGCAAPPIVLVNRDVQTELPGHFDPEQGKLPGIKH